MHKSCIVHCKLGILNPGGELMETKITIVEINELKGLLGTQNNLIYNFEQYSKQLKEPQLRAEFQKMYAILQNHKNKLLSVLDSGNK